MENFLGCVFPPLVWRADAIETDIELGDGAGRCGD